MEANGKLNDPHHRMAIPHPDEVIYIYEEDKAANSIKNDSPDS